MYWLHMCVFWESTDTNIISICIMYVVFWDFWPVVLCANACIDVGPLKQIWLYSLVWIEMPFPPILSADGIILRSADPSSTISENEPHFQIAFFFFFKIIAIDSTMSRNKTNKTIEHKAQHAITINHQLLTATRWVHGSNLKFHVSRKTPNNQVKHFNQK